MSQTAYTMFYEDLNCGKKHVFARVNTTKKAGSDICQTLGVMTCNCRAHGQGTMFMTTEVADFYNRTERAKLLKQMEAILPPAEFEHYERSSRYVAVSQNPKTSLPLSEWIWHRQREKERSEKVSEQ